VTTPDEMHQPPDPESIEVGLFRPEDAEGVCALFRSVYGDGYPIKHFYDRDALIRVNENRENYTIVARTPQGEVVAVHNLFRSAPYQGLYEWGAGLVLKEWRRSGVNKLVCRHLHERIIPALEMEAVFGEAVCNHTYMQETVFKLGYVEMAIEVALMPAEAYEAEKSSAGRVAGLLAFGWFRPRQQKVYLPGCYEQALQFGYSGPRNDPREFKISRGELPSGPETQARMTVFDFARVARIAVSDARADFGEVLRGLEAEAFGRACEVIQVWVKLSSPWVGAAVDILRQRGYFLGGALPRWFDDDGLLMQKIRCAPDFEDIHLLSDRAKKILEFVKQDYAEVSR
jgi:hypothetical protein